MSSVSSATGVAAVIEKQTLAALRAQLERYSQSALGQFSSASADYKALQYAIESGNISAAQAALARLQRDSDSAAANLAPAPTETTAPDPGESSHTDKQASAASALNATA
jgi:hypothetical protein